MHEQQQETRLNSATTTPSTSPRGPSQRVSQPEEGRAIIGHNSSSTDGLNLSIGQQIIDQLKGMRSDLKQLFEELDGKEQLRHEQLIEKIAESRVQTGNVLPLGVRGEHTRVS